MQMNKILILHVVEQNLNTRLTELGNYMEVKPVKIYHNNWRDKKTMLI